MKMILKIFLVGLLVAGVVSIVSVGELSAKRPDKLFAKGQKPPLIYKHEKFKRRYQAKSTHEKCWDLDKDGWIGPEEHRGRLAHPYKCPPIIVK